MNAARLLAHYERVADAPDAIARLRRFVLELAVRGKLVPQDPKDEPASSLLKRIVRKTPHSRNDAAICNKNAKILVPAGWAWTTLGEVADVVMGQSPPGDTYNKAGDGVPLINGPVEFSAGPFGKTIVNQYTTAPTNFCEEGNLLICVRGSTTGRTNIAAFRACIGRGVAAIKPRFDDAFIRLFIWMSREFIIDMGRGIAFPSVNRNQVECLAFPLPPLAEQQRIVAKVEELMTLCDRLETARTEREAARDRLSAASIARLNAPDPDPCLFADHTRFALDVLPAVTTRRDHIKQLRQTILNLAVRGRLAPQDPKDGKASELIRRIEKEIANYARENRITQRQPELIGNGDLPYAAPAGWQWTRLCALFKVITDGDHQPPPTADEGVAFLTIGNITTGRLNFSGCRLVPDIYFHSLAPYRTPVKGDILYTVVGATYGRAAVVDTDRDFCVQRHIAILKPSLAMNLAFLVYLLSSPLIYDQASRSTTGTAQPTIALRPLRNFVVPIPPLAEQHRVVAKVDELMSLCDRLEASLGYTDATRGRLLDALLQEALTPAEQRDREAA